MYADAAYVRALDQNVIHPLPAACASTAKLRAPPSLAAAAAPTILKVVFHDRCGRRPRWCNGKHPHRSLNTAVKELAAFGAVCACVDHDIHTSSTACAMQAAIAWTRSRLLITCRPALAAFVLDDGQHPDAQSAHGASRGAARRARTPSPELARFAGRGERLTDDACMHALWA